MYPIPAFKDNYIWVIADNSSIWVVDPGDATPVFSMLQQVKKPLAGILITHHHADHTGGIQALLDAFSDIPVIASHHSQHPLITHSIKEGDSVQVGSRVFKVLEIPGHTLDHIAFWDKTTLFSGDTLFSAGCGKVFEGTYPQMFQSLTKLLSLDERTELYCGHEYTLANLQFAEIVEPENLFIKNKIVALQTLRQQNLPTLPSTLSDEKQMNPFLRCDQTSVINAVETYCKRKLKNPIDVFTELRQWKNNFNQ